MATLLPAAGTTFIISGALQGAPGSQGLPGISGLNGTPGTPGAAGLGVPSGGAAGTYLVKNSSASYDSSWQNMPMPASGSVMTISQAAHGFTVGQILKLNVGSGTYSLSQANATSSADVVGMVIAVVNANSFNILTDGYAMGLSGLSVGAVYFLSPTTAGAMTTTEPLTLNQVRKPLFTADSTSSGYFHIYEGILINSASYGGTGSGTGTAALNVVIATSNYTATDADDIIVQTFSTGTVTMQSPANAKVKPYKVNNQTGAAMLVYATSINSGSSYSLPDAQSITLLPVNSNFIII